MTSLEIEIKFYMSDLESFEEFLRQKHIPLISKSHETNIRFENQERSLYAQHKLLRLRQAEKTTLTFKSKPRQADTNFKIHHELEVTLSDFKTTKQILEAIGFHPVQIYEKKRSTWRYGHVLICLDRMPYGDFIELEGAPDAIFQTAREFGFNWKDRILMNYLEIFDILKQQIGLPFSDVTFAHFEKIPIDIRQYLPRIQAGDG